MSFQGSLFFSRGAEAFAGGVGASSGGGGAFRSGSLCLSVFDLDLSNSANLSFSSRERKY